MLRTSFNNFLVRDIIKAIGFFNVMEEGKKLSRNIYYPAYKRGTACLVNSTNFKTHVCKGLELFDFK